MNSENIKLIVGLGNPGAKYDGTRHNIGFEVIEQFAKQYGFNLQKEKKFHAWIATREVEVTYQKRNKELIKVEKPVPDPDQEHNAFYTPPSFEKKISFTNFTKKFKLILAMPQTFMNESGKAVREIVNFYKLDYENMLVLHDDVSLDTGKLKPAFKSGAGGQHGIEDIIQRLSNRQDFHRLKIGVGPDPGGDRRADYVLSRFPQDQEELIETIITDSVKQIGLWLSGEDPQQVVELKLQTI